jgi:hypothetical protein
VNLSASLQNDTVVVLSWKDITEGESGFVIQRTNEDSIFMSIDTVDASATGYTDTPPGPDRRLVYRVIAIADELRSIPSKQASIELLSGLDAPILRGAARIYPNPFKEHITFEYRSSRAQGMHVRLYDIRGILVADLMDVALQAGTNHIAIPAEGFSQGIYVLEYQPEYEKAGFLKLIGK